ncbi:MAG: F0F1 ATP synthase subunit epsilon [Gammaproteobacteria bacterium]|jgi:F-type H+-transporting ATPase subunit epsilon|nr:F0F1 ATP synthase subunit epsilon [Gammaproteobacteria bacterium]
MAMTMHVDVVSVEELLFSGLAEFVAAPAEMGEVGIYPRHAPMIALLKPGLVRLKIPHQTQEEVIYVSGGLLEVQPQGVTILSDMAVREKTMEEGTLWDEKRKTEDTMKNRVTAMEYAKLEIELAKALAHLQGIQKLRRGK